MEPISFVFRHRSPGNFVEPHLFRFNGWSQIARCCRIHCVQLLVDVGDKLVDHMNIASTEAKELCIAIGENIDSNGIEIWEAMPTAVFLPIMRIPLQKDILAGFLL